MNGAGVKEGASNSIYLATSPEVKGMTGEYFVNKRKSSAEPITYDTDARKTPMGNQQSFCWFIEVLLFGRTCLSCEK